MASIVVGGMALAAYFSVSWMGGSSNACRPGFGSGEAWNRAYQSPSNWLEALYMFAEALRCVYQEIVYEKVLRHSFLFHGALPC